MFTIQANSTHANTIAYNFKRYLSNAKDTLLYNLLYKSIDYFIADMQIKTKELQELLDENNIDFIKKIDLDNFYDEFIDDKEVFLDYYDQVKNLSDKKNIKLAQLTDALIEEFAKQELVLGDIEHILVLDKKHAS